MKGKVVVCVAGMPGAGKAVVVEVAKELGFGIVVMGDEVREETKRLDLEPTPENVGKIMLKMREEGGPAVVAKRCIPKIEGQKSKAVIVDGVRSIYEADEFRRYFPSFKLVAIHASPETRFTRLFKRKRSDDPASWETFLERDWRELHVGVGDVIASSDVMLVNEGQRTAFKTEISKFLKGVIRIGRSKGTSRS